MAAAKKPIIGDSNRAFPTSIALFQLTPERFPSVIKLLASPTPSIEPMSVWELETGSPIHQVPKFHMTPARSNAMTMTIARELLPSIRSPTGSKLTMLKENRRSRLECFGVDDCCNGVGRIVESVDEFERKGDK